MGQLPADGAPGEERTAGCRLTTTRRVDVDVVAGWVDVLLASAERGGTGWSAEARVEEGYDDRSVNTGLAFMDVGCKGRCGQARDGDFPAHLVVSRIQG